MSDYIVSARKYRPDSFESLIGQDNISQTLKNSILRGQLAHAYLFCGPRGVGKTSTARIFAKTINCSNPTAEMEPCGECESCQSFAEGRSYCIHELDAASNNGVEDIKALMDQVQIPPQVGRYSVYIIDEVHMLSSSAFNAFLKTLEEPPAHAIFILCTTEKHKILPTILSRCQTYDFNRIGIPDIVRNLRMIATRENITIGDESLHVIAHKADGAMRDALTIFDQTIAFCGTDVKYEDVIRNLNVLDYEYSFKMVDAFLAKDYATALLTFDDILAKGFNAQHFIADLGSHLRDLLVSRTGGLESLLDLPDSLRARYQAQAARCPLKFIFDALGIVSQCEAGYRTAVNQRLHIEFALMRLAFLGGLPADLITGSDPVCKPVAAPAPVVEKPAPKPAAAPAEKPAVAASTTIVAPAPVVEKPAPAPTPKPEPAPVPEPKPATAVEKPAPAPEPEAISLLDMDDDMLIMPADEPVVVEPVVIEPAPVEKPADLIKGSDPVSKPRRRTPKTGTSLSISSLMNEETAEAAAPEQVAEEEKLPDDDLIVGKWKELAAATAQPRLANALANAKLDITTPADYKQLEFSVTNEAQKAWIESKMLRDLEDSMRERTGSHKIRLSVAVLPEEVQPEKKYMPSEKAQDLIEKNPDVKNLVIDLGLDIR